MKEDQLPEQSRSINPIQPGELDDAQHDLQTFLADNLELQKSKKAAKSDPQSENQQGATSEAQPLSEFEQKRQQRIKDSQNQFKLDLEEALKELAEDNKRHEPLAWYEYNTIKLNPFTTSICVGGVAFGGYMLVSTGIKRNYMTKQTKMGRLLFGFSLVGLNLLTIASNVVTNRKRAELGYQKEQQLTVPQPQSSQ